ncbi:MAG: hypothetical protein Udaeo2_33700 [Candidatus Udaeobacter sp.]|nr:MAG: hypothetical protein Udaeo2_33700 [Candidatus Udaeobacter sp.]
MPAGEGPVRYFFRNELTVRNDELRLVIESNNAGANAYTPNHSGLITHLDEVAHLHGPLEKKNQAGKEIVEDVLETEAGADTECTGEDGELRHVGAECGNCDIESDQQHDVVHKGRDCVGRAAREVKAIVDFFFEEKTQKTREKQRDPDGENEGHDRA